MWHDFKKELPTDNPILAHLKFDNEYFGRNPVSNRKFVVMIYYDGNQFREVNTSQKILYEDLDSWWSDR